MAEEKAVPVKTPPVEEKTMSREEVYQKYLAENGGVPEEPNKETEVAAETDKTVAEKTAAPEPEKEQVATETKPKEEKVVPYGALHEERLKRQTEQKLRKEAEERAKALDEELKRLKTADTPPAAEITDYEKELIDHRQKLQALETVLEREQREKAEKARQEVINNFNKTMSEINTELEADGYVGFGYMKVAVAEEIKRLISEDESNAALDTKEGWKKTFIEKFYPEMESKFAEALKKKAVDDKIALKKDAGLGTMPGKAPAKPKSDEDLTPEEQRKRYIEMRRARG